MSTRISPSAGKPAPPSSLIDVAQLVTAYYLDMPDLTIAAQRAARASGTEDIHKIYAESFIGSEHLQRILEEAQAIVDAAISPASSSGLPVASDAQPSR